jgi:hypothetical protein
MISLIRGDTRTLQASVYTTDEMNLPQSLSDVTVAKFTARLGAPTGAQVFQKTLAGRTIRITDAPGGLLEIDLTAADTTALATATVHLSYDLELTWSDGQVRTVDIGTLVVSPDVTY